VAPKLPPVNATLTKVEAPQMVDDYTGEPIPGTGEVFWEGSAPAYLRERVVVETGRGTVDQLEIASLVIPSYVPEVVTGRHLTFERAGETFTRTARNIEPRPDQGYRLVYFADQ